MAFPFVVQVLQNSPHRSGGLVLYAPDGASLFPSWHSSQVRASSESSRKTFFPLFFSLVTKR